MSQIQLPPPIYSPNSNPIRNNGNYQKSKKVQIMVLALLGILIVLIFCCVLILIIVNSGESEISNWDIAQGNNPISRTDVNDIFNSYRVLRGNERSEFVQNLEGNVVQWTGIVKSVTDKAVILDFGGKNSDDVILYFSAPVIYEVDDMLEFTGQIDSIYSLLGTNNISFYNPTIITIIKPLIVNPAEPTLIYQTLTHTANPTSTATPTSTLTPTVSSTPTMTYTCTLTPTPSTTATSTSTSTITPTSTKTPIPPISINTIYHNHEYMTGLQFTQYKNSIIGKTVSESITINNVDKYGNVSLYGPWKESSIIEWWDFCVVVVNVPKDTALQLSAGNQRYLTGKVNRIMENNSFYINCETQLVLEFIKFGK